MVSALLLSFSCTTKSPQKIVSIKRISVADVDRLVATVRVLRARIETYRETHDISETDWEVMAACIKS